MESVIELNNDFYNTIYDNNLHDYINGNLIINLKLLNKNIEESNNIIKNIIIDYYLHLNKIKITKEIYDKYSLLYNKFTNNDNIINNYYQKEKKNNKINEFNELSNTYNTEKNEEEQWENDRKIHYNQYFGRYNDLLYIIDYYNKLKDEEENKEYIYEENDSDYYYSDDNNSDYDDYYYESLNDDDDYYYDEEDNEYY